MSLSQLQEENKFKKHLGQFWGSKGITQIKIPQIGGQQLNLYKLYKSVCKKGGGQQVSHNKMWKEIVDEFGLPSTCTSASFTLKNHYQRYLLAYEQKYFFGKDENAELPELVAGRTRKTIRTSDQNIIMPNRISGLPRIQSEGMYQSTLAADLQKYYEKAPDKNVNVKYFKRAKMYPANSQVKHMILAFESGISQQVVYAINILTLYSVNTQAPFLFNQYPNMLQSIFIYLSRAYPPTQLFTMECLRNLTNALRNLSMNYKNLSPILDSPLLNILKKMFLDRIDRQVIRNILDIFTSMFKVGWQCKQLSMAVQQYIEKDNNDDLQIGLQLLRIMADEKQDLCQEIVTNKRQLFSKLLINHSIEIREGVLKFLAFMVEKSEKVKNIILHNHKLLSRIVACLSCSQGYLEKQAQLAGFIISSFAQTQENLQILKRFQKELMLISFNDESLSSITASILYNLYNNPNSIPESLSPKKQQSLSEKE